MHANGCAIAGPRVDLLSSRREETLSRNVMADVFSKRKRSLVMSRIRGRGNKDTETVLARLLRANQITGWRRHRNLVGRPDFTFQKQRVIIFIDGCFWHGCPEHGTRPKSNTGYWDAKLKRNAERDRAVDAALASKGWHVLRFWEHELKQKEEIIRKICSALAHVPLAVPNKFRSNRSR
jgi:DNA mismatch endonuclease (patch repair protein)